MDNLNTKDTILFVDDDQIILNVCTLMIEELGYKVLQAENGKKTTQIFRDKKDVICLVILDMILPDENGSDICKKLKEFEPDVKVLHTSGLGKSLADDGFECGCEAFLRKPFQMAELGNKLKEMLETT